MINESKVMSKGGKAFESIGLICDVEPKASNRFDKKYTINININEMIMTKAMFRIKIFIIS